MYKNVIFCSEEDR